MDKSTKQRYISTSIWSDEWFDSLSVQEKLIYFHLLTNEFTNAAGVYHFSLKQIQVYLGIPREDVQAAIEKFEAAGKAYYFHGYIVIPKWLKHQKISERNKIFLGALSILKNLPDDIKRFIADRKHYDFPVEKYVEISPDDSVCPKNDGLSPVNDGPCPVNDGPFIGHMHDSDSDSDSDLEKKEKERSLSPPPFLNPNFSNATGPPEKNYAMIFEEVKAKWKEVVGQETRETLFTVSPAKRERFVNTLAIYSLEDIFNAIGNYQIMRNDPDEFDIGGRTYGNLIGFLENGVSQFFYDQSADSNFRRRNHG
jgi:hypothetical protein